jgi:hypothetical protein
VISLKQRLTLNDTLLMDLPEDHQVTFPEAARLSDAHARLIKEVLANTSQARGTAIETLAQRFRLEFGTNTELASEAFLRALLADHIFLTGR